MSATRIRRAVGCALVVAFAWTAVGCSGAKKSDYDELMAEKQAEAAESETFQTGDAVAPISATATVAVATNATADRRRGCCETRREVAAGGDMAMGISARDPTGSSAFSRH